MANALFEICDEVIRVRIVLERGGSGGRVNEKTCGWIAIVAVDVVGISRVVVVRRSCTGR